MAERQQVLDEYDNAKFTTKGAKLMNYVLTETSLMRPPDSKERDAQSRQDSSKSANQPVTRQSSIKEN